MTKEASITLKSKPTNVNHEKEGWKGGRCGKCGARHIDQQLGLENVSDCLAWARGEPPCPQCYVCDLRQVARELWRVLRDDGTLWLVLGDSFSSGGRVGHGTRQSYKQQSNRGMNGTNDPSRPPQPSGLTPKNLVGIPWHVAFALQADGWTLRSEIIWAKPNPMPGSQTDRPTVSHEQVFLLTKQARYFYDAEAVAECATTGNNGSSFVSAYDIATKPGLGRGARKSDAIGTNGRNIQTRTLRDVWTFATEPYTGAHYATFPTALVERCIKAGTSQAGCCAVCGSPCIRQGEYGAPNKTTTRGQQAWAAATGQRDGRGGLPMRVYRTIGWVPGCDCDAAIRPCTVFDPFVGAGTVPLVARALGRYGVGMDLSWPYLHDQARPRLQLDALAAWEGEHPRRQREQDYEGLPLFSPTETL